MVDIDKIIVLENKEQYLVLNKTIDNDVEYYYIAKLNETETDIENNYKLITIVEADGNTIIQEVTGEDNLRRILPLFQSKEI